MAKLLFTKVVIPQKINTWFEQSQKKKYVSNWLSNTSVAAIIVGGFQQIDTGLQLLALAIAIIFFVLGYILDRGE